MKVYVDKLDKPDVHLCQAPHRFGKNEFEQERNE